MQLTPDELKILTQTVLGEAGGDGAADMAAVASVIKNRTVSGRFPANPTAVALQSNGAGVHQFSTWNNAALQGNNPGRFQPGSAAFSRAAAIVQGVFSNTIPDPTSGATHYVAASIAKPAWWDSEAPAGGLRIGNQIFAQKSSTLASKIVAKAAMVYGPNGATTAPGTTPPVPLAPTSTTSPGGTADSAGQSVINGAAAVSNFNVPTAQVPIDEQQDSGPIQSAAVYSPYSGLDLGEAVLNTAPAPVDPAGHVGIIDPITRQSVQSGA